MTFREALEREIAAQGLAVAEIAEISGVSKGAIYNILNGKTDDVRVRPATRRALARGCNRELVMLDDGGVRFVEPGETRAPEPVVETVGWRLLPGRPFLEESFLRDPFDWLYTLEEDGRVSGTETVDRVFQRRRQFLSLVVENGGRSDIAELGFELRVAFDNGGPTKRFPSRLYVEIPPGGEFEQTLFLQAGPQFQLQVSGPSFTDSEGQAGSSGSDLQYVHRG